jgi:hypothetical protein
MNKRRLMALTATLALWSGAASADDKGDCFDAASQAQTLRDGHKLVEARGALRVCARQVCPAQVRKDCTTWLDAVEQSLPTVVIGAKDPTGRDLLNVTVTVDGHLVASSLTGEAIPFNPGPHAFHFSMADGRSLDQDVLVREGLKNQNVAVVLPSVTPAAPLAAPAPAPVAPAPAAATSPWRTAGWVIGGAGVVALGTGIVAGVIAVMDKTSAQCNASGACEAGPLSDARGAATASTVALVTGGVLVAGGAALVLFAPRGKAAESTALRLSPMVGTDGGGLRVAGGW